MRIDMKLDGVPQLIKRMQAWDTSVRREVRKALTEIGNMWVREAKLRVPVRTGLLRNSINKSVVVGKDYFELAVGSHVKYAPFIEYGTRFIAGGAVAALGTRPNVTDAEAITDWPAKRADNAMREQMPFLRPSFMALRPRIMKRLHDAMAVPPGPRV